MECPTCGDQIEGADCPRCDWGGWSNVTPHDNTANPSDPTLDLHRGIQARVASDGLLPCPDCGGDVQKADHYQYDTTKTPYQCSQCRRTFTWPDIQQGGVLATKGPPCPKCGDELGWRDSASLGPIYPEGAWQCYNRNCFHNFSPGQLMPDSYEDPDTGSSGLTLPEHWGGWRMADVDGYTNWDTFTVGMALKEQPYYEFVKKMVESGQWSPQKLSEWAIRRIIGPFNKQQIADAKEWNEIPEEERLDHNYESLKEKNPEAADLVNGLGFGPDVSDTDPNLVDPELVNWDEIYQEWVDSAEEDREFERGEQQAREKGLGWATNGGDGWTDDGDKMRDAFYRYHGALPDEELPPGPKWNHPQAYHNINLTIPYEDVRAMGHEVNWPETFIGNDTKRELWSHHFQKLIAPYMPKIKKMWPNATPDEWEEGAYNLMRHNVPQRARDEGKYDVSDPHVKNLIYGDPGVQNVIQNGYPMRLHDVYSDLSHAISWGKPHPYTDQMQQALQQRGYSPEEIQSIMRQRWRLNPETNQPEPLEPRPAPQPDPSLDQPGDFYLPSDWEGSGGPGTFSRVIPWNRWWFGPSGPEDGSQRP